MQQQGLASPFTALRSLSGIQFARPADGNCSDSQINSEQMDCKAQPDMDPLARHAEEQGRQQQLQVGRMPKRRRRLRQSPAKID
eukprot:gene17076-52424_t